MRRDQDARRIYQMRLISIGLGVDLDPRIVHSVPGLCLGFPKGHHQVPPITSWCGGDHLDIATVSNRLLAINAALIQRRFGSTVCQENGPTFQRVDEIACLLNVHPTELKQTEAGSVPSAGMQLHRTGCTRSKHARQMDFG